MSVNLCIDWGNTNVKIGIFDQGKLIRTEILTGEAILPQLASIIIASRPDNAILSAVVDYGKEVEDLLASNINNVVVMDGYSRLPIHNAYFSNDTVGTDRLALVTAAWVQNPEKNTLVVSLGTCVTYNFVTKNKTFRGGAISPGMQMRLKSMHQFTDKLPEVDARGELLLLGYDTPTCMRSGAIFGMAAEIDGMVEAYAGTYSDFNAILTGGDAPFFASKLKCKIFADPDLLLKGLNLIVEHNVPFPR